MSEIGKDRRNCVRATEQVEARVYATMLRLNVDIPAPKPSGPHVEALKKASQHLSPAALRYILNLDLDFAERTGMEMNPNLKLAAQGIIKKLKGGDVNDNRTS